MPLPHNLDPEERWWIDVSAANPALENSMRPTLMAFFAFDKNRTPQLAGTGFIMGSNQQCAIVVSAKHVFAEDILKHQRPHTRHSSSALFVSKRNRIPSLDLLSDILPWLFREQLPPKQAKVPRLVSL